MNWRLLCPHDLKYSRKSYLVLYHNTHNIQLASLSLTSVCLDSCLENNITTLLLFPDHFNSLCTTILVPFACNISSLFIFSVYPWYMPDIFFVYSFIRPPLLDSLVWKKSNNTILCFCCSKFSWLYRTKSNQSY